MPGYPLAQDRVSACARARARPRAGSFSASEFCFRNPKRSYGRHAWESIGRRRRGGRSGWHRRGRAGLRQPARDGTPARVWSRRDGALARGAQQRAWQRPGSAWGFESGRRPRLQVGAWSITTMPGIACKGAKPPGPRRRRGPSPPPPPPFPLTADFCTRAGRPQPPPSLLLLLPLLLLRRRSSRRRRSSHRLHSPVISTQLLTTLVAGGSPSGLDTTELRLEAFCPPASPFGRCQCECRCNLWRRRRCNRPRWPRRVVAAGAARGDTRSRRLSFLLFTTLKRPPSVPPPAPPHVHFVALEVLCLSQ